MDGGDPLMKTINKLDEVIANGNRYWHPRIEAPDSKIRCADGFTMSVIAGAGTYCTPVVGSSDYRGPYSEVEVGFPSRRPEPWGEWQAYAEDPDDPTATIYARVPVKMVRDLAAAHGGVR